MDLNSYLSQKRGLGAELARKLDVSPVMVSQWQKGVKDVPAERCPDIEKATDGAVTCEELRADVDWATVRSRPAQPATESLPQ